MEKLIINGTDHSKRVRVNVHEFNNIDDANEFAKILYKVLTEKHNYRGDVWVVENGDFFVGQEFNGDIPDDWTIESYDTIWSITVGRSPVSSGSKERYNENIHV